MVYFGCRFGTAGWRLAIASANCASVKRISLVPEEYPSISAKITAGNP